MAVNILGVVAGTRNAGSGELELPPLKSLESSVEPVSIDFLFRDNCWQKLYKYLEANVGEKVSGQCIEYVAVSVVTQCTSTTTILNC